MLKRNFYLGVASVVMTMTCQAGSIILNGKTYALTTGTYSGTSDWEYAIDQEFGTQSTVADFTTLKLDAVDADALWDFLVAEEAASVYIKWNGEQYVDGMPIFMNLHENFPGSFWFVLDFIDPGPAGYPERIDLGRWDIGNQRILAQVVSAAPVPEPATFTLAGLGLLGYVFSRRRN